MFPLARIRADFLERSVSQPAGAVQWRLVSQSTLYLPGCGLQLILDECSLCSNFFSLVSGVQLYLSLPGNLRGKHLVFYLKS